MREVEQRVGRKCHVNFVKYRIRLNRFAYGITKHYFSYFKLVEFVQFQDL